MHLQDEFPKLIPLMKYFLFFSNFKIKALNCGLFIKPATIKETDISSCTTASLLLRGGGLGFDVVGDVLLSPISVAFLSIDAIL